MIQFRNSFITVFESHIFKTTSAVLQTDDCVIVVDPTWLPREVDEIRRYVDEIRNGRPVYLVLTHSDWDHVLGYGAFSDATVIGSESLHDAGKREHVLQEIKTFDDQYYLDRHYTVTYPNVDIPVQYDGQSLHIGETVLTFYNAKGHTNDGIFTIVQPGGAFIAGDYLSDVEFPFIYFSSAEYERTLVKISSILANQEVRMLVPGHGNVAHSQAEICQRQDKSLRYIRDLRNAVESEALSSHLLHGYSYLSMMSAFHEDNIRLMKEELTARRTELRKDEEA